MTWNPAAFSLTEDEVSHVQAEQSRRQTIFAQEGATRKPLAILFPLGALVFLLAIDHFALGGAIPTLFYVGFFLAYLMGLFIQLIVMARSLRDTKQRALAATPQVWEERDVELTDEALVQTTSSSRAAYAWTGIQAVTRDDHFVWFWLTKFEAVVVPLRAFSSTDHCERFEAEARRRVTEQSG